jgi:hypothetical protein
LQTPSYTNNYIQRTTISQVNPYFITAFQHVDRLTG